MRILSRSIMPLLVAVIGCGDAAAPGAEPPPAHDYAPLPVAMSAFPAAVLYSECQEDAPDNCYRFNSNAFPQNVWSFCHFETIRLPKAAEGR